MQRGVWELYSHPGLGSQRRQAEAPSGCNCRDEGWFCTLTVKYTHRWDSAILRHVHCLALYLHALLQSHFSTGSFWYQKRQDPEALSIEKTAAPRLWLTHVHHILMLEPGANSKLILPHKSLTTCAAKRNT